MIEKIKVEDPKKQVKMWKTKNATKKQTSFESNLFSHFFYQEGNDDSEITKTWKYTMYQKDKSEHIFVQYVSIYFRWHLLKPDAITIFVYAVWISTLDIKVLQLSHALFVQKLFP